MLFVTIVRRLVNATKFNILRPFKENQLMGHKKLMLCILDGWGHGQIPGRSAIAQARTPFVDSLYQSYPNTELISYGAQVGLPEGQMGNSEVGHLNIGAGRIVYQELARINKAIREGEIEKTDAFRQLIEYSKTQDKPVHLMGLLSDGGVHSHIDHIIALANLLAEDGLRVYVHAFLDGRDTSPRGGASYLSKLISQVSERVYLSTIIGRYYAMDRDNRWERITKAYQLLVNGKGTVTQDAVSAVNACYERDITDEFMEAIKMKAEDFGTIQDGDAVLFANFRTDRPRQLTKALTQQNFPEFDMSIKDLYYLTMTEYDDNFKGIHVIFTKDKIKNTLGEVISEYGLKQLRIAETEKYPHVTFFFSGGRENEFENEHRILVHSPKVATYDLQPEMSAHEVTDKLITFLDDEAPDLVILNYANADMVGHTGVFEAAVKSAETLDDCLSTLIPKALEEEYRIVIIADHGNSDLMINDDGTPHTAHTMNPVPLIVIDPDRHITQLRSGKLADIAPTILDLMGLDKPEEMTGISLLN